MSTQLRERIPGGIYHVMNRGVRRVPIFEDERDRKRFTHLLIAAAREHDVQVYAGTQMTTHFHIIVETRHANISEFMQALDGAFAQYSNRRHHNAGHLFGRPFRAVVIEDDLQLFIALWYVFNNPCAAGIVARPEQWRWSTYAATIGLKPKPDFLSLDWLEALFPADALRDSQRMFKQCIDDPDPICAFLRLNTPESAEAISCYVNQRLKEGREISSYRKLLRPPLEVLFAEPMTPAERDLVIVIAHIDHGYRLSEIARATRLHAGSVSRIFRNTREVLGIFGPENE